MKYKNIRIACNQLKAQGLNPQRLGPVFDKFAKECKDDMVALAEPSFLNDGVKHMLRNVKTGKQLEIFSLSRQIICREVPRTPMPSVAQRARESALAEKSAAEALKSLRSSLNGGTRRYA